MKNLLRVCWQLELDGWTEGPFTGGPYSGLLRSDVPNNVSGPRDGSQWTVFWEILMRLRTGCWWIMDQLSPSALLITSPTTDPDPSQPPPTHCMEHEHQSPPQMKRPSLPWCKSQVRRMSQPSPQSLSPAVWPGAWADSTVLLSSLEYKGMEWSPAHNPAMSCIWPFGIIIKNLKRIFPRVSSPAPSLLCLCWSCEAPSLLCLQRFHLAFLSHPLSPASGVFLQFLGSSSDSTLLCGSRSCLPLSLTHQLQLQSPNP